MTPEKLDKAIDFREKIQQLRHELKEFVEYEKYNIHTKINRYDTMGPRLAVRGEIKLDSKTGNELDINDFYFQIPNYLLSDWITTLRNIKEEELLKVEKEFESL